MALVKLNDEAANTVMQLTAKLWQIRGGQRPTYDETVSTLIGNLDDETFKSLISRHDSSLPSVGHD
jgi:hypothetical protein